MNALAVANKLGRMRQAGGARHTTKEAVHGWTTGKDHHKADVEKNTSARETVANVEARPSAAATLGTSWPPRVRDCST